MPWPAAFLVSSAACVSVYHPLSGLQSPVAIDPALGNLHGLRILVHCVPRDLLEDDAGVLCTHVGQLFENQGAEVKTLTTVARSREDEAFDDLEDETSDDAETTPDPERAETAPAETGVAEAAAPAPRPDLVVELRAHTLYERRDFVLWTLSWLTATLAPGLSERAFVQEVMIRDDRGSVLAEGDLQGRIVTYFGLGYWATSTVLDLVARDEEEEMSDANLGRHLSADLYAQLSQMAFNASLRRRVLERSAAPGGRDPRKDGAP
jgi:hypothetical protein